MTQDVVRVSKLRFAWKRDPVVSIDTFSIAAGEKVFLRGPSGSGKTTFLSLIAGVLTADEGSIEVLGQDVTRLSSSRRDALRASQFGVIFQMFNLVPYLSVAENVAIPCRFSRDRRERATARGGSVDAEAQRLLRRLGLVDKDLSSRTAAELSVGQQQRVAAARALIGSPALIIADEPTSSLDADARSAFIDLLSEEAAAANAALLFVSHDASLAQNFDRVVHLPAINQVELLTL